MDGLKVKLENSGNHFIQNFYYNGWKCETWVVNILCFTPDGKIVLAGLYIPELNVIMTQKLCISWASMIHCAIFMQEFK